MRRAPAKPRDRGHTNKTLENKRLRLRTSRRPPKNRHDAPPFLSLEWLDGDTLPFAKRGDGATLRSIKSPRTTPPLSALSTVGRFAWNYGIAVFAVMVATALALLGGDFLAARPFIPFFLATLVVVVSRGSGPGLLATLLSLIIVKYFFLPAVGSFEIKDTSNFAKMLFFTTLGLVMSMVAALISRRRRALAEASARESESRYRSLFETSRDGIVTVDLSGRIMDANPAYRSMLGYTMDELRSLTYQDFTPSRWHQMEEAIVRDRILAKGDSGEYEKEYIHNDGSIFPVSLRAWSVVDAGGDVVAMRAFVRDISDRKRAEEALRDADRRKNEFIAALSHELRNPLATICNGLQVLRRVGVQGLPDERPLQMMERQVEHLVRLVDDLLDASRISHGKIELIKERLDLGVLINGAADLCREQRDAAGVRIRVDLPEAPMLVEADPVRLAQVFGNLLHNAVKHTGAGGDIEVALSRAADEAVVSVADTGVGIPQDALPHLFDLFVQVKRTRGRPNEGLGIGLSLVRSLVELHGGAVEAHSDGEGRGSRFVVRLPLSTSVEAIAPPPAGPCTKVSPRRVLVVDDTRDAADSLVLLLETLGANVRVAYSGAQALEACVAFEPELVFLDLGMPQMDGFETARRMRASPSGRSVSLIALTGWGEEETRRRARQAGFDRHLTKPATMPELKAVLGSECGDIRREAVAEPGGARFTF
jgi:PAS domain S-box-containing protein